MKALALVLILAGAGIILFGGYRALGTLASLYQRNLEDPMGQPDGAEQAASSQMLRGVMIGAAGVPLLLAGHFVRRKAWRRRRDGAW
jgi:hypothetical protein